MKEQKNKKSIPYNLITYQLTSQWITIVSNKKIRRDNAEVISNQLSQVMINRIHSNDKQIIKNLVNNHNDFNINILQPLFDVNIN